MADSCGGWTLSLSDALWVPDLDVNLISVCKLASKGVSVVFDEHEAIGNHVDGDVVFTAKEMGDVYCLETVPDVVSDEAFLANIPVNNDPNEKVELGKSIPTC